jgi:sigma-E factor negative regulatory protein RseB
VSGSGFGRVGWWGASLVGAAFWLAGPTAHGEDGPADSAVASARGRSPVQWLQAIESAAQRGSYTGTIVYQHGDEVRASRIVHFFDASGPRERVQTLDGRPREFIRQGDQVQCLYPQQRRVVIEHARHRAAFPALGEAGSAGVLEHYALQQGDVERVAGVECQVLKLVPLDTLRYGYRLWVDPGSGLLLKVQMLSSDESVIEQIAFSDVRIGEPISAAQLKPSWSTNGWSVVRRESHATELSRQGWSVTAPDGFRRLTEVERNLENDPTRAALQAVYSDGLATVSVFIEPGAAAVEPEPAQRRGPLSAFTRQVGDARVTVVGDVPPTTARTIAESVRFSAGH